MNRFIFIILLLLISIFFYYSFRLFLPPNSVEKKINRTTHMEIPYRSKVLYHNWSIFGDHYSIIEIPKSYRTICLAKLGETPDTISLKDNPEIVKLGLQNDSLYLHKEYKIGPIPTIGFTTYNIYLNLMKDIIVVDYRIIMGI